MQTQHLALLSPTKPLLHYSFPSWQLTYAQRTRRGRIRLYRVDAADPLVFQGVLDKRLVSVVFHQDEEGHVDHLSLDLLGFYTLYKRPRNQSLRVRLGASVGGGAALAATGIGWLALKRRGGRRRRQC